MNIYGLTNIFNDNSEKIFIMKFNIHMNIVHFLLSCSSDLKKIIQNKKYEYYFTDKEKLEIVKKIIFHYENSSLMFKNFEEIQNHENLENFTKKIDDRSFLSHNYSSLFFNLCFFYFIKEIFPYLYDTKLKKIKIVKITRDEDNNIVKNITPIKNYLESFDNLIKNTNIDPLFFICNSNPNVDNIMLIFESYIIKSFVQNFISAFNLNKKFNFVDYEKKYQYYIKKRFPNFEFYADIVENFFIDNIDCLIDNVGFIPIYFLTEEKNLLKKYEEDDIMLSFFIDVNNHNDEHLEKINFIFNGIKTISGIENMDFVHYNANDLLKKEKLFSVILKKEEEQNFVDFIKTILSINKKTNISYNYRYITSRNTLKNLKKIIDFFST